MKTEIRKQKFVGFVAFVAFVAFVGFAEPVFAGNLDSSAAPTDDSTRMYTLQQIYNRLHSGTPADKPETAFVEPTTGPVVGTMKTLDQILDDFNADVTDINTPAATAATAANVTDGIWFFATTGITRGEAGDWGPVKGTASAGSDYGIPKTGQTTPLEDYDDGWYSETIGTPATGDKYATPVSNTVIDNGTGLMWVQDPSAIGTVGIYDWGTTPNPNTFTWENALLAITALNAAIYAGHNDWRLPNIKELQSLVNYGNWSPAIGEITVGGPNTGAPFINTLGNFYWSSTSSIIPTNAWIVDFFGGEVDKTSTSGSYFVRPVCGG